MKRPGLTPALKSWLDRHCLPPEDGDCRLFRGRRNRYGYAYIYPKANGPSWLAHRYAWMLAGGELPRVLVNDCGHRHCCLPAHWRPFNSVAAQMRLRKARGQVSRGLQHSLSIRAARRAQPCKLSVDLAREIRALDRAGVMRKDIAARFGVSRQTITSVCQNRIWRETTPFSI